MFEQENEDWRARNARIEAEHARRVQVVARTREDVEREEFESGATVIAGPVQDVALAVVWIALGLAVAMAAQIAVGNGLDWYMAQQLPLAGPVLGLVAVSWSIAHVSGGLAAWCVTRRAGLDSRKGEALLLYGATNVMIVTWAAAFFVAQSPWLALLVGVLTLDLAWATTRRYFPLGVVAAGLMLPVNIAALASVLATLVFALAR